MRIEHSALLAGHRCSRATGKQGHSLHTIAAKLGRTCKSVSSKAALLGLSWPLEFRAWENVGGKPKLTAHQQAESLGANGRADLS